MKITPKIIKSVIFGPKNPPKGLVLRRIIGSLDIDGKGTQHELAELSPWILVDESMMVPGTSLPFGRHPHTGLCANTCPINMNSMLWDNQNGIYGPLRNKGLF